MLYLDAILHYGPMLVTGASIVSAALPEPKQGSFGAILKGVINAFALNVANAKNQKPQ